jgi:hypothetical protein
LTVVSHKDNNIGVDDGVRVSAEAEIQVDGLTSGLEKLTEAVERLASLSGSTWTGTNRQLDDLERALRDAKACNRAVKQGLGIAMS